MRIIFFSCFITFLTSSAMAQDYGLYWKYKDYKGISLTVPSVAIDMGSWFVKDKEDRQLMRHVNKVRVMVFEGASPITKRDMRKFDRKAKRKKLEELITVHTGDTDVRIMVKERRKAIRKMVVLVHTKEEFVMVSVKGKLKWNDINKLIKKYGKDIKGKDDKPVIPPSVKVPVFRV
jgi:Domain of unknown function (DUF4252)